MDVTTTLKVQKLGRMMLRLDEAPAAAFSFSDRVDGSPWSLTFSPVVKPYSGDAHVGGSASSYSCRPEGRCLEHRGSISPMGPRRADPSSTISIQSPGPSLIRRHSCPRPSSVGHPREGVLTESCLGRTVSSRPSIIPGRQGYPITSMKVQKVHLRHAKAFAPDHVMRKRISCHRCGRRHQAGIRLL